MQLKTFGDSITAGAGASSTANRYANLLAASLGRTLANYGVNGNCAADQAIVSRGVTFSASDIATLMIGANDSQRYFTTVQQGYYGAFVREIVAAALLPSKVKGRDSGMSKAGTWVDTQPSWSYGCRSNVSGSEATCTVQGESIYIGTILQDMNGGPLNGEAEVWVDGEKAGIISSSGQGMPTAFNSYAPACYRFAGFSASTHEVKIKLISGWIYLEYVAGSDQPDTPSFYLSTVCKLFQQAQNDDPTIQKLNIIINALAAEFIADGFDLTLVGNYHVIGQSDLIGDGIHPNDTGHAKLSEAFFAAMATIAPVTYVETPTFKGSDCNFYIGEGAARKRIETSSI